MQYELIANSDRGILIERTPVMRDIRDTYEVSFLLPDDGSYIVLFKAADGAEYRKTIKDSACKIPKELLTKEQYTEVTVCKIDNEKVLQSWNCEPLRITAFLDMRRTQWQLSAGMTEENCLNRLAEIEYLCADFKGQLIAENAALKEEIETLRRSINQILDTLRIILKTTDALENGKFKLMSFKTEENKK